MSIFKNIAFQRLSDYGFSVETFPHGFDVAVHHEKIVATDLEAIKEILWASNCDYLNIRNIEANKVRITLKD